MRISDWSSDVCSSDLLIVGEEILECVHGAALYSQRGPQRAIAILASLSPRTARRHHDVPGPDPHAAEILGRTGMCHRPADGHGNGRRHVSLEIGRAHV